MSLVELIGSAFFGSEPVVANEFTIEVMAHPHGDALVRFTRKDGVRIYETTVQRGQIPFTFGVRGFQHPDDEYVEPWSWIPHVEGADRQKEINAYLRDMVDRMYGKSGV